MNPYLHSARREESWPSYQLCRHNAQKSILTVEGTRIPNRSSNRANNYHTRLRIEKAEAEMSDREWEMLDNRDGLRRPARFNA